MCTVLEQETTMPSYDTKVVVFNRSVIRIYAELQISITFHYKLLFLNFKLTYTYLCSTVYGRSFLGARYKGVNNVPKIVT